MKSQPKSPGPGGEPPSLGACVVSFSLTLRRHCIARRASQPPQIWGLQMVTLFLAGPLLRFVLRLARQMADDYGCVGVVVDAKPEAGHSTASTDSSRSTRSKAVRMPARHRRRRFSRCAPSAMPLANLGGRRNDGYAASASLIRGLPDTAGGSGCPQRYFKPGELPISAGHSRLS